MSKKLAKIKYLPNNFRVIEPGDHVICAVSGKFIFLENLNYWNVDLQEPYYSYVEANKRKNKKIIYFHRLWDQIQWFGFFNIIFSSNLFSSFVISSIDLLSSKLMGLLTII